MLLRNLGRGRLNKFHTRTHTMQAKKANVALFYVSYSRELFFHEVFGFYKFANIRSVFMFSNLLLNQDMSAKLLQRMISHGVCISISLKIRGKKKEDFVFNSTEKDQQNFFIYDNFRGYMWIFRYKEMI